MIRLRLQRRGRRKRPYFHIVAADQRSPRDGRVIERLGRYDNVSEQKLLTLDEERIIHWLRVGAQPSDTVRSLLKREGILYKLHLIRWGKSEEEIEAALEEWKSSRSSEDEDATSRKEQQKSLLEAEAKEYKKQLEEKAAQAAREAEAEAARIEAEKAEAEAEAAAEEADASEEEADDAVAEADAEETEEVETAAEESTEEVEEETAEADELADAEEPETKAEAAEETTDEAAESDEPKKEAAAEAEKPGKVSTDMNANEAIDHIKNTPLEELKGFVPESEDRVTVQRAWESKTSEE